jgi:hypothetical protein
LERGFPSSSNLGNTVTNWIGRSNFSADPYFDGLVDDFRIPPAAGKVVSREWERFVADCITARRKP